MYLDEVVFEPLSVVSVLATAALFQLDGLLEKCTEIMNETMTIETAVSYYDAAIQYGLPTVKKTAFNWLLINLMNLLFKTTQLLQTISIDLMESLISSPDLYVMPIEFSVYILLKSWMFIRLNPEHRTTISKDSKPTTFYTERDINLNIPFLETSLGEPYMKVFKKLRFEHLLNYHLDLMMLLSDRIIPHSWLNNPLVSQWSSMLKIDQSLDKGPFDIDERLFYSNCIRCGRVLMEENYQKWRWNAFTFGMDFVLITDSRVLSIKRHHRTENERLLSLQTKRTIMIRATITSMNDLRQVRHTQTTGIKQLTLDKNEEAQLMIMDKELVYPLLISMNLLIVTPNKEIETILSSTDIMTTTQPVCSSSTMESGDSGGSTYVTATSSSSSLGESSQSSCSCATNSSLNTSSSSTNNNNKTNFIRLE